MKRAHLRVVFLTVIGVVLVCFMSYYLSAQETKAPCEPQHTQETEVQREPQSTQESGQRQDVDNSDAPNKETWPKYSKGVRQPDGSLVFVLE